MGTIDDLAATLRAHRDGLLFDLVFAVAWVTVVSVLFGVMEAPRWVTYLAMAAGVLAYYGFVASLEAARDEQ